jgi:O-antigen/teichoic acid export membrane protein
MVRDVVWVMGFQIASRGSLIVFGILLSNILTREDFFQYQYFVTTSNTLLIYTVFGMNVFSMRQAVAFSQSGDRGLSDGIWSALLFAIGLSVAGTLLAFSTGYSVFFGPSNVSIWVYVLASVVFSTHAVSMASLNGLKKYRRVFCVTLVANILLVVSLLSLFMEWPVALVSALGGYIGYFSASSMMMIVCLAWVLPMPQPASLAKLIQNAWLVIVKSLPNFLVSICVGTILWGIGRNLVAQGSDPAVFSTYAICLQIYALMIFVPNAVGMRLFPEMVKNGEYLLPNQRLLFRIVVRRTLILTIAVGLAILGLTPFLIALYGNVVSFGYIEVLIIAFLSILSVPLRLLGETIVAQDRSWLWLSVNVVGLLFCVVALVCARPNTAAGALLSLVFSYSGMLGVTLLGYRLRWV